MTQERERPGSNEELYEARADEIGEFRLYMTGDVFNGIPIPGFGERQRRVCILTHPCSMRVDGVNLAPRLLVAEVRNESAVWDGRFDVMPLPNLLDDGGDKSVHFANMGMVKSEDLDPSTREVVLGPYGINILQQRFVFYLTRAVIGTHVLHEVSEAVYEETSLAEEWIEHAVLCGYESGDAHRRFHEFIREDAGEGSSRQELLRDPQRRAMLRTEIRSAYRQEYGSASGD